MAQAWLAAALVAVLSAPQSAPHGSARCAGLPRTLPGQAVADAITTVPSLATFAAGINSAGRLAAEMNGVPQITVFAPVDEAFAKTPGPVRLDEAILRYHMVPKHLTPDRLVGTHRTLQGGQLSVARGSANVRVNATAGLICTRMEAANGSVYLIDTLLTPPR